MVLFICPSLNYTSLKSSFHAAPALSKEAIAEMSPSAAAASALMKKGMSLTQVVKYDFEFGFLWSILETGSEILSFYSKSPCH